jgi:outer membrane receptor protein involved in Fe transport
VSDPVCPGAEWLVAVVLALLAGTAPAAGQEVESFPPGPPVPTGVPGEDRLPPAAPTATVLVGEDLQATHPLTLAGPLSQIPGLSLFGGASSLVADPSTQWVTVRGAGPGGISRALVLLDGIPVNDPFGGWIPWARLPILGLERVEVIRGPVPLVWGTSTTGGLIRLVTPTPGATTLETEASYWDHDTVAVRLAAAARREPWTARIEGGLAETDGFDIVRGDRRGALDVPADGRFGTATQTLTSRLSSDVAASLTGWYLADEQGLGTPGQSSATDAGGASLSLRLGTVGLGQWDGTVFASRHEYRTTVTALSPDRASERPVFRQEIPADTAGGTVQWTRRFLRQSGLPGPHLFTAGADVRWIQGESQETSTDASGALRPRHAGGQEVQLGVFAQDIDTIYPWLEIMMGVRGAYWRSFERFAQDGSAERSRRATLPNRESLWLEQRTAVRVYPTDAVVLRVSEASGFGRRHSTSSSRPRAGTTR